jgi:hypothetical protein
MRSRFKLFLVFATSILLTSCGSSIQADCDYVSLRSAIYQANQSDDHTVIHLDDNCTIITPQDADLGGLWIQEFGYVGRSAFYQITTPITIEGHGGAITRGKFLANPFRFFTIAPSGNLTLNDIDLWNGAVKESPSYYHYHLGGGIFVREGILTLNNSKMYNSEAEDDGGAIYNYYGTVYINGSEIINSEAGSGGGIFNNNGTVIIENGSSIYNNDATLEGGGIYNQGTMTIISSEILYSNAEGNGGGIYNQGELSIMSSEIYLNGYAENGGGIYHDNGTITISETTLQENYALGDGGGLAAYSGEVTINTNSTFDGNTALNDGGGIFNGQGSTMTIEASTISSNQAQGFGGGINNISNMTIHTSTIKLNTANQSGGGVDNSGELLIHHSTVQGNQGMVSAGGVHDGGALTMINSTVSGNMGGVYAGANAAISHCTIAYNKSDPSGQGGLYAPSGAVDIKNSIVALNSPINCDIGATLNALGENLDDDGTCTGFVITADPLIGPLAMNGGMTSTHALLEFSPAIEAATDCTDTTGSPVTYDQRYASRSPGPECDIGAYEEASTAVRPPTPTPTPPDYSCDGILGVSFRDDGTLRVQFSTLGLPKGTYHAKAGKHEFICKTYDEYPDRLFCDGPKGEEGTLVTLIIYDPFGNPFCEEPFSIPVKEDPVEVEAPEESVDCSKYTTSSSCNSNAKCEWEFRTMGEGVCVEK